MFLFCSIVSLTKNLFIVREENGIDLKLDSKSKIISFPPTHEKIKRAVYVNFDFLEIEFYYDIHDF